MNTVLKLPSGLTSNCPFEKLGSIRGRLGNNAHYLVLSMGVLFLQWCCNCLFKNVLMSAYWTQGFLLKKILIHTESASNC